MKPLDLKPGDLIFLEIDWLPFRRIAQDTNTWCNHVGVVVNPEGQSVIAESTIPVSRLSNFEKFVARSKNQHYAVKRLPADIDRLVLNDAVQSRLGIRYDTGFNLNSSGQFCSKFARQVVADATGIELGEIQTLRSLFQANPDAHLTFWRFWYFLTIPWDRETVTPASIYNDPRLITVFEGSMKS